MVKSKYILGLNISHTATACLLKDGVIIGCVSEERFTQKKNQDGFPMYSVEYLLNLADISSSELDLVVNGGKSLTPSWDPINYYGLNKRIHESIYFFSSYSPFLDQVLRWIYKLITKNSSKLQIYNNIKKNLDIDLSKIVLADHHTCHAYASYFGFTPKKFKNNKVTVITCDAEGDMLCATIWEGKGRKLKLLNCTPAGNSPASIYADVTRILGMKINEHEYKVMGLAPYAKSEYAKEPYEILKSLCWFDKKSLRFVSKLGQRSAFLYLKRKFSPYRFDSIASAVQKWTEELMVEFAQEVVRTYGVPYLAAGGGWFMNVKGNMEITKSSLVKNFFVCPSGGDESLAIGACYWGWERIRGKNPKEIENLYLGPNFSDEDILRAIKNNVHKKLFKVNKIKNIEKKIAELIFKGDPVARFTGRMEWGARALGNRSILADPRNVDIKKIINEQIKNRDFWMPFAPSISPKGAKEYLVNPKNISAKYMVMAFETTIKGSRNLKAALHPYDDTARPQIVDSKDNFSYYKVIEEFRKLSGVCGVLNTSFNLHGFPIVCTPEDAIRTFVNSDLKYLALNNYLLIKKDGKNIA